MANTLMVYNGGLLIVNGALATSTACCCESSSSSKSSSSSSSIVSSSSASASPYLFANAEIPVGTDSITITGLALDCKPLSIKIDVGKPSEASEFIFGSVASDTITTDGFTVILSASVPSTGYILSFGVRYGDCISALAFFATTYSSSSSNSSSSLSELPMIEMLSVIDDEQIISDFFNGEGLDRLDGLADLYKEYVATIESATCEDCATKRARRKFKQKIQGLIKGIVK